MQEDLNQNTMEDMTLKQKQQQNLTKSKSDSLIDMDNTKNIVKTKKKSKTSLSSKSYSKSTKLQKLDKSITNTFDPDNPNVTANNKGDKINKKALMRLSDKEHFDATISDMAKQIEDSRLRDDDPANVKRYSNYLCNNDNKAFHLEIIKRAFTKQPVYLSPDDFAPVAVDYFQHCYKFNKMPTMVGLSSFAGINYSTFRQWLSEPQNLFYPIAQKVSDIIHDMTLSATMDGNVNINVLKLLAFSEWSYKDTSMAKTTNVNLNFSEQKSAQEKLDHINALKLSHLDYDVKTESSVSSVPSDSSSSDVSSYSSSSSSNSTQTLTYNSNVNIVNDSNSNNS